MNEILITNHNELVDPNDLVIFVGDICMGRREETLPLVKRMNGYHVLVPGNHCYCHPMHSDNAEKYARHCELYKRYFDDIIYDDVYTYGDFVVCHLPYNINQEDHADRDFGDYEPMDIGMPLLCGHVHEEWKTKTSQKGTFMLNVGVDAHNFTPISYEEIVAIHREHYVKD